MTVDRWSTNSSPADDVDGHNDPIDEPERSTKNKFRTDDKNQKTPPQTRPARRRALSAPPSAFHMDPQVSNLTVASRHKGLDATAPVIEVPPPVDTGRGRAHERHLPLTAYVALDNGDAQLSLLDTGANLSVIDEALAHKLGLAPFNGPTLHIDGVGSGHTSGWVTSRLIIPATRHGRPVQLATEADFHVLPDFGPGLCLGLDVVTALNAVLDVPSASAEAFGATFPIFDTKGRPLTSKRAGRALTAKSNTTIPPRCHAWVPFDAHLRPATDYVIQSSVWTDAEETTNLALPSAVIDDVTVAIMVTNFGDDPVTIRSNTRLGTALPLVAGGAGVGAGSFTLQSRQTPDGSPSSSATCHTSTGGPAPSGGVGETPDEQEGRSPPTDSATDDAPEEEVMADPSIAPTPIDFAEDPLARLAPDPTATQKIDGAFNVGLNQDGKPHPEIVSLLRRHRQAFSLDGRPGRVTLPGTAMPIPLLEGKEITPEAPRRSSPEKRKIESAQIEQLRDWDVIEPSTSPASFPVLLVKQGAKWRFCVDYRGLNKVSKDDRYPLPRIDDIFEALAGNRWFSGLDAIRGYHQLDIEEADRWKTAFICSAGLFQYKRVPFGLKGAPAWFQRFMDRILGRLRWIHAVVYLDDVVVFSKTIEQHVEALDTLLTAATQAGLRFSPDKCHFGLRSLALLGRQLSSAGVSVQQRKTQAVRDIAAPKTLQDLYHVLGLFNYYREFIPRYAQRALPMTRLLKGHRYKRVGDRDKKWSLVDEHDQRTTASRVALQWGPEQQAALDDLKDALSSPPTLAFPDYTRPFILYTDASQTAFAAALHQDTTAQAFPLSSITPATTVPLSLERIRQGQASDTAIRAIRARLQGRFDSDTPSASDDEDTDSETDTSDAVEAPTVLTGGGGSAPPTAQLEAPHDEEHPAPDTTPTTSGRSRPRPDDHFALQDGLVVYVGPHRTQRKVYLPSALLHDALAAAHDQGHFGLAKTLPRLDGLYYPRLATLLRTYIDNCPPCLRTKAKPRTGQLSLERTDEACKHAFHSLSMDLVLGLPVIDGLDAILVIVDMFSKTLLTAACTSTITADGVYRLFSRLVLRRGWNPKVIVTDSDTRFIGEYGRAFAARIGAVLQPSAPYHQQANPVERHIQTLKRVLRTLALQSTGTWVDDLDVAEPAINATPSLATGFSPDDLLYIHKPNSVELPSTAALDDRRVEARARVEEAVRNLLSSQTAAKERFDRRHQPLPDLREGDRVFIRLKDRPVPMAGTEHRLDPTLLGPFPVEQVLSDHRVRLALPPTLRLDPHFDRSHLQPCPRDPDPFGRPLESSAVDNSEDDASDTPSPAPQWELERIVGTRNYRGYKQYRVLWKNDPMPTWEFEDDLREDKCDQAISDFHANLDALPARRRKRNARQAYTLVAQDLAVSDAELLIRHDQAHPSPTERPIAFISTPTSASESKLLGLELEMSCLAWALHQLRHYLEGAPEIIVVTDHAPLGAVLKASSKSRRLFTPRIERLRTYLLPFLDSLSFVHRAGKAHGNVDALSRLPHSS
ncbi:uncharacterized protein PFL1_02076 [Pseudozyma flocculosa PF-1]|uniref:uncharacterized protein n=1 Tax=Pseudozyma flocculosa PF-1 TaxID=1277687 RepID=UPI0004561824|nr:uncharacterized protein PFL1_02076 [Pseudozyma flocculosa PF-1]EPQ30551.1 hypothetical protein PFL1_02076 [Pseudozyma flocculosa PF-1]